MLKFKCPQCGEDYEEENELLGRKVACASCSARFYVPKNGEIAKPIETLKLINQHEEIAEQSQNQEAPKKNKKKYCDKCGKELNKTARFCTRCGREVADLRTPFLDDWETNVYFSGFGLFLSYLLILVSSCLISYFPIIIGVFIVFPYICCSIFYALYNYPSLFTDKACSENSLSISFKNCFYGGIIFGLCWNSNLTKHKKGISHIVYCTLYLISYILFPVLMIKFTI